MRHENTLKDKGSGLISGLLVIDNINWYMTNNLTHSNASKKTKMVLLHQIGSLYGIKLKIGE